MTDLQLQALIDQARATETFRDEKNRLGERCVQLERIIERDKGIVDRIETKVKALFAEVERQSFDDNVVYTMLDDLEQAVLNAIRRG